MTIKKEVITSRNNTLIKWVSSLHSKKGREENGCFFAEGIKLVKEALEAKLPVTYIFLAQSKKSEYLDCILKLCECDIYKNTEIVLLADEVFEKISTENAPQGVLSVIKYLDFFSYIDIIYKEDFFLPTDERAIILCSVRDPANLGSVIRSAVAFGVDRIILSDDCAELYNPKTVRSAMGSLFRVKATRVRSLEDLIPALQSSGRRVLAAELSDGAVSLKDANINTSDCVIIGNEGHGISREISSLCNSSVYIPISKRTESLNAAVAAAIFMWDQNK